MVQLNILSGGKSILMVKLQRETSCQANGRTRPRYNVFAYYELSDLIACLMHLGTLVLIYITV